jgi:glycogen synthase
MRAIAGLHLIKHAAWRTLDRGGQFVLLGSAPDPKVQVMHVSKISATESCLLGVPYPVEKMLGYARLFTVA